MTQRIFDVDNPQDVKDLFALLPNKIRKIRWSSDANIFSDEQNNVVISCSFICIAWRGKTEITRPVDKSKWIGCLCEMWNDSEHKILGILQHISTVGIQPYICKENDSCFIYCRPVRRDEVKFVEDNE